MERFKLTRDLDKIKVEDTLNGVACVFEEGFFNESQRFFFFGDARPDPEMLARCTSEMGDWLRANHYDLLFSEDEGEEDEELDAEEEMLLGLLSFEEGLEDVYILFKEEMKNGATFYLCSLIYAGGKEMTVSFIHYDGQDWLFTPWDWQGFMPMSPADIEKIDWRVNDTDQKGLIFDGLPMLAPWEPNPRNTKEAFRQKLGEELREARRMLGLSVLSVERDTGVSRNIINRTESGRANTTIDTIALLCDRYGLDFELVKK